MLWKGPRQEEIPEQSGGYDGKADRELSGKMTAFSSAMVMHWKMRNMSAIWERKFGISDCMINTIGPTIGAHSGPGTVALFFFGDNR